MAASGYDPQLWERAIKDGRALLTKRASRRTNQTISYSELAGLIRTIRFDAHDSAFHALLGDISVSEDENGRGMLSVLVVHKGGDYMPGTGFFELADALGRDAGDKVKFWAEEFEYVIKSHSKK